MKKNPRKLPSYAPQNSPVVSKFTIDYKQIVRNCNSYKSPTAPTTAPPSQPLAKPVNLFENFNESPKQIVKVEKESPTKKSERHNSVPQTPALIPAYSSNNNNTPVQVKSEPKPAPKLGKAMITGPVIIQQKAEKKTSEKEGSHFKPPEIKKPMPKPATQNETSADPSTPSSRVSKIFDFKMKPKEPSVSKEPKEPSVPKEPALPQEPAQPKVKERRKTPKYDTPKYEDTKPPKVSSPSWTPGPSIISQSVGVYKPGIGFCETASKKQPKLAKGGIQIIKSEPVTSLNSSLDFNDPYNSIPDSTSPDADLSVTSKEFDYKPFQETASPEPIIEPKVMKEPVIKESDALIERIKKGHASLLEKVRKEPTPSPASSPERSVEEEEVKDISPKKDWLSSLPKRKCDEDEVFGKSQFDESPTKRFKKTFHKPEPDPLPEKDDQEESENDESLSNGASDKSEDESDLEDIGINPSPSPPDKSPVNSGKTTISSSPPLSQSQSSDEFDADKTLASDDSDDDSSEEYAQLKKERKQKKLDEMKNLKLQIFEKRLIAMKEKSSSSSEGEEDSSASSPVKKHRKKPVTIEDHYESDSDSIDSSASVEDPDQHWLESDDSWDPDVSLESPGGAGSPGSPQRKRKKLSSPQHSRDERRRSDKEERRRLDGDGKKRHHVLTKEEKERRRAKIEMKARAASVGGEQK